MAGWLNPLDTGRTTTTRPTHVNTDDGTRKWYSDDLRTRPHAQDLNAFMAQLRNVIDHFGIVDVEGDDTLLLQAIQSAGRESINNDVTYYVRPDGNDGNDGSADTAPKAFKTIQRAIDQAQSIDVGGWSIFINIGNGTFNEATTVYGGMLNSGIYFTGNGPANTIINAGNASCITCFNNQVITVEGIKFIGSGGVGTGLDIESGSSCYVNGNCSFDCDFPFFCFDRSAIYLFPTAAVTVIGAMVNVAWMEDHSSFGITETAVITFQAGATVSDAVFAADDLSTIFYTASSNFSGTVTGTKFRAILGAVIDTNDPNKNLDWDLPGSANGKGLYAPPWLGGVAFRNLLNNSDGRLQEGPSGAKADDVYGLHNRWYVLSQSGSITPSTITNVGIGLPNMIRLVNTFGSPQRMGYAQIIEGKNCKQFRNDFAVLSGIVRRNENKTIRCAILEWTGTEDVVTSDIVANWVSGTFTPANFFNATSLTVVATASVAPGANIGVTLECEGRLSNVFNNLIVFVWTEDTAIDSTGNLDMRMQLEMGGVTRFEERPIAEEQRMCSRYYQAKTVQSENGSRHIPLTKMRAAPTVAVGVGSAGSVTTDGFELTHTSGATCSVTATAEL